MKLKRHYDTPAGWEKRVNARLSNGQLMVPSMREGDCLNPPPLKHVELQHTGTKPEQNFSETLIEGALKEGWASFEDTTLVLDVKPEPLRYTVLRTPGRYCCHCKLRLPDNDDRGELARAHVAELHAGVASPDRLNPAGYERIHFYETVLDPGQHARFNVQQVFENKVKHGKKRSA